MVYDYVEKAGLSKGYQNPKRKLGVTTHFSKVIELKFGKKLSYILCILKVFGIILVYLSLKNAWVPTIFFLDSNNPC